MNAHLPTSGVAELSHWGVIRAQGADAAKFLHGQLTQDFALMALSQARLAAFCSAKGRMQASFVAWKAGHDEIYLACSASILPATLKRLSMFVLRAQCKLSDASAELRLQGLVGEAAESSIAQAQPWQKRESPSGVMVRLPDALGLQRALLVSSSATQEAPPVAPPLALETWQWLEVHSGVPMIEAATVEQFVPQMLNLELIGGVDFKKGCYPGQEVVARSQYRGTLKRRMFVFDVAAAAAAGQEVFDSLDSGQPAGMVVQAAAEPGDSGIRSALVEVKLASLESGHTLHLGSPDGPVLTQRALPYEVPLEATTPS